MDNQEPLKRLFFLVLTKSFRKKQCGQGRGDEFNACRFDHIQRPRNSNSEE